MALAISNIPVLTGEVAERFVQQAEENYRHRGSIDFSRQREECHRFELRNARRVEELRTAGKWPFCATSASVYR